MCKLGYRVYTYGIKTNREIRQINKYFQNFKGQSLWQFWKLLLFFIVLYSHVHKSPSNPGFASVKVQNVDFLKKPSVDNIFCLPLCSPNMLSSFKSKIGNVYCPVYILKLLTSVTRTIYSNSERSEQFLVTECYFNLEVSQI